MSAELIRWNDSASGSAGQFGPFGFIVSRVYSGGKFLLVAYIPGMEDRRARGDLAEVKATAESWLREFVSSLGAVFTADLRPELERLINGNQDLGNAKAEAGSEQDRRDACENWGRAAAYAHVIELLDGKEAK